MGRFGGMELLLILLVVLLLFGAKRLPDLSRSLGRSLRILKAETKALHDDDGDDGEPRRADRAGEAGRGQLAGGAAAAGPPAGERTVAGDTGTTPVRASEPRDVR